ncbi:hypothetical protein J3E69DRAFT_48361 [Trichoderma sp. SZMC 28015]
MIPIKNADIHRTDPASTYPKPIYRRQTASTETAYPATASLVTIQSTHHYHLHTLFDLNHTLPLSAASKPHQQQSQRSNLAFLLMQGQHINPKEKKGKKNPAISPLDPASSSPSPTWKRNDKKEGPETRPPIAINSETNVAMHFRSIQKH